MGVFEQFPYANMHEMNLDWLLKKMKELTQAMETFKATESLKFADPIIWDITTQYEKSTIVLDPTGNAYLSIQAVPAGIQLNNDEYWLEIFNFTDYTRTANQNLTVNTETNTTRATADYQVDDWLIWNDVLYKVTAAIAIDDAFIVAPDAGSNIVHFTVEDFLKAFITYATGLIQQYKNDIDASELAYRQQLAQDIASTTASLQAQLDQAISGATVDSEVINARIGADGVTYATLGDAIRTQFTKTNNKVAGNRSVVEILNGLRGYGVTPHPESVSSIGLTISEENGRLKVYGTSSSGRNFCCFNGQFVMKSNTATYSKTTGAGTYECLLSISGHGSGAYKAMGYTETTFANATYVNNGDVFTVDNDVMIGVLIQGNYDYGTESDPTYFDVYIHKFVEKEDIVLQPTNDTSDRTNEILNLLSDRGIAKLGKGTFYIDSLNMPNNTSIVGSGNDTILRVADGATKYGIKLGDNCKISQLRMIGADSDFAIPDSLEPTEGSTNLILGDLWVPMDGYIFLQPSTPLQAGGYRLRIKATSNNPNRDELYIKFVDQLTYATDHVIATTTVYKDDDVIKEFTLPAECKSIWIFADKYVGTSSGYTVTLDYAVIHTYDNAMGNRSGIIWTGEDIHYGTVDDCKIERFNYAGIKLSDTGYGITNELHVTNCQIRDCIIALAIDRNSEFNKITNNTFSDNFYGVLNRGGNNYFVNCACDWNRVDFQIDNDEGSNGGHSSIVGCSLNHADENEGYGLVIKGTGRMMVTGCNFYYAKIKLENTNGNVINACGFGRNGIIEVDAGTTRCNIISNCMFLNANAIVNISGRTKVNNCWTRTGVEVTI